MLPNVGATETLIHSFWNTLLLNSSNILENFLMVSNKVKYIPTILWPGRFPPRYICKRKKLIYPQKDLYKMFIVALIVITLRQKQTKCLLTREWINSDNGILHSNKKATHCNMDGYQNIILNKVSQTQKNAYPIVMFIWIWRTKAKLIYGEVEIRIATSSLWFCSGHVAWDGQEGPFWEMNIV